MHQNFNGAHVYRFKSNPKEQRFADALGVFSDYDKNDFTLLKYEKIEVVTPKAALIDGVWCPKSQMKVDTDNNLWLSNWLYEKNFK